MYRISGCKIDGIVACLPEQEVDNRKSLSELYGAETENIVRATGIEKRRIVSNNVSSLELFFQAAKSLMNNTKTCADDIGAIICVTFTPKYRIPFNSTLLQERLSLKNDVIAFDLNLACSGYVYGLYVASLIAKNINKKVLLLDGDVQSIYTSPYDKGTLPVLSDSGTATLISPNVTDDEWLFDFYTDGSKGDNLIIKAGGSLKVIDEDDLKYQTLSDGSKLRNIDLYMNGFEIFKFVAKDVVNLIKSTVGDKINDIDIFVPHQANMYMIKQLARSIKVDAEKMWKSGDVFGNSGSASVAVTIAHNAGKLTDNKQNALLTGFGGGLSASVGILQLYKDSYFKVNNYKGEEL